MVKKTTKNKFRSLTKSLGSVWYPSISGRRVKSKSSRRRTRRYTRSDNKWYEQTSQDFKIFNKTLVTEAEKIWLEARSSKIRVTYERLPECEKFISYQSGDWNGMATVIRISLSDSSVAMDFRTQWWNKD